MNKWEDAKDEFCIALIPYLPVLGKVSNDLIQAAEEEIAKQDEEITRLREEMEKRDCLDCHTDGYNEGFSAALEEAAKVAKEPLDNPTEEEIAQMAQGMTIGEIKANRILKLIEL